MKSRYLELIFTHPKNVYEKFQKDISFRPTNIPILAQLQYGSKQSNRQTDIYKIQHYFEQVCKHHRNASKNNSEDISFRTGYIPKFVYFSKKVSQQTDRQYTRN